MSSQIQILLRQSEKLQKMEWKVYAANKTCYVLRDGTLVETYSILKNQGDGLTLYSRGTSDKKMPTIEQMKLIAATTGKFLYDRTKGLNFNGLAKKVDEAGEIAFVSQLHPEAVKSRKAIAKLCIEQAKQYLRIGPAFNEQAKIILYEIDKYDPDNQEYQALLKSITD